MKINPEVKKALEDTQGENIYCIYFIPIYVIML